MCNIPGEGGMERREEMGDQIAKSDIHEGGGGEGEGGWMGREYQSLTSLKPTLFPMNCIIACMVLMKYKNNSLRI